MCDLVGHRARVVRNSCGRRAFDHTAQCWAALSLKHSGIATVVRTIYRIRGSSAGVCYYQWLGPFGLRNTLARKRFHLGIAVTTSAGSR